MADNQKSGSPSAAPEKEKPPTLSISGSFVALKGSRRLKKMVIIVQAITVAVMATYGATRSTGEDGAKAGYSEMSKHLTALQTYAKANDKEIIDLRKELVRANSEASLQCKAEVHAIRLYVTGYLLALSNRSPLINRRQDRRTKEALQILLRQSAKAAKKQNGIKALPSPNKSKKKRSRPKLKSPAPTLDKLLN